LRKLASVGRLQVKGKNLFYRRFLDDYPVRAIPNSWDDTASGGFLKGESKIYVVQTNTLVIQRCLLMTTDPGDLVFDPSCGSGTTAFVAEQWGRRWITCDTSRVPLALARQRLLTATFPWYELKGPSRGPAGGFVYVRKQNKKGEEIGGLVPHITLKSIANNESPVMETLVNRPEINNSITRITGPFTVEATIPPADDMAAMSKYKTEEIPAAYGVEPATYLDRMIEVLRRCKTLRLPGNKTLSFEAVHRLTDMEFIHAEAIEKNNEDKRVAIVFGPSEGAITSDLVVGASAEAYWQKQWQHLYLFGFAIQAKARELLKNPVKTRIPCTYVAVTPDVVMSDLLKTTQSSEIFSITGLPDIAIKQTQEKNAEAEPLYQMEVQGLDIFDPATMETHSIEADNLPCWMLDTDYNDLCFYATQVFFPKTSAWDNLQRALKGAYEPAVWAHLAGTVSEPFSLGKHRKIAVKVIDDRGNELMVVREVSA
jgi:adenine-specific DNA-methyltransferase